MNEGRKEELDWPLPFLGADGEWGVRRKMGREGIPPPVLQKLWGRSEKAS